MFNNDGFNVEFGRKTNGINCLYIGRVTGRDKQNIAIFKDRQYAVFGNNLFIKIFAYDQGRIISTDVK